MGTQVHSSAIVDEGASIGNGVKIWHFSHICSRAKIGNDTSIGQNVFVADNVSIGARCKIQNNVSLYDGVVIEDEVFCGPSMVFTNVNNPRAFIERKSEYQKTFVKHGATLGANSTILCGCTIGEYAFIGAGAFVNKNVKNYSLMVGVPARQVGWVSKLGEKMDIPLTGEAIWTCNTTGQKYALKCNEVFAL